MHLREWLNYNELFSTKKYVGVKKVPFKKIMKNDFLVRFFFFVVSQVPTYLCKIIFDFKNSTILIVKKCFEI